ncbi:MAG: TIM barrel protein, partial [Chitinophagaceae bacterium]|nr:TIM barrel protein [Chitinophagaceae bacterium]
MKYLFTSLFSCLLVASIAQTTIGVQLYTFRTQIPKDVPGMLSTISKMGLREVEGGGTYGLPFNDYKQLLEKNQLKMVSIGADFNKLQTDLPAVIAEAKAFGASYVTCFWIPHTGDDFTLEDVNKAITVFNTAGKVLKENGLSLCYHPHGYEFRPFENGTLFDRLVTELNPQYANFEMDVFWIKHPGQDPVALLKKYPNRFPLMHLKDRKPGTEGNQFGRADVETNVVLGTGDVG